MRTLLYVALATWLAASATTVAYAHPGGLDANGCHYKRGHSNYHCHRTVAPNPIPNAKVKKSRENICHDQSSPNYRMVRYFIEYDSMLECLASGGEERVGPGSGGRVVF